MCACGDEIAETLSRRFGWALLTRADLFSRLPSLAPRPHDRHMLSESAKYFLNPCPEGGTFLDRLTTELNALLDRSPAILVGFGSQIIFTGRADALHIRIIADREDRIRRAEKEYGVTRADAERILDTADKKHHKFVGTVFHADLADPSLYHLVLNTSRLSTDACVDTIESLAGAFAGAPALTVLQPETGDASALRPVLKNRAEEEFAQILDMYEIDWTYEPRTFPVEWDAEGNVTMAFSPDFYLTKFDTYIELTTMDQRYVTLKNKKARRVRELYPGTNIKVVYKKDFYALAERFNLVNGAS
jgi:hypothetical protein